MAWPRSTLAREYHTYHAKQHLHSIRLAVLWSFCFFVTMLRYWCYIVTAQLHLVEQTEPLPQSHLQPSYMPRGDFEPSGERQLAVSGNALDHTTIRDGPRCLIYVSV